MVKVIPVNVVGAPLARLPGTPLKPGLHVFGEVDSGRFLGPRLCQCGRGPLTVFSLRGLLPVALDGDASISAFFQLVGHLGNVSKGVKDLALERDIRPSERLAGPQPPYAIGERIVRVQPLRR